MVLCLERKVVQFAIISRLLVVLQLMLCSILPKHEADIFSPPVIASNNSSTRDKFLMKALSGFINWDSRYFLFITNYGYMYENTLVFLPLFPVLTSLFSYLLYPLRIFFSTNVLNLVSGILLNNISFVLAARQLYVLGCRVVGDNSLAYKAALIFCFNPASVFFSVFYSESLFFLLALSGLIWKESSSSKLISLFLLSITSACRSNGMLFAVFFIHSPLQRFFNNAARVTRMKSWIIIPLFFSLYFLLLPGIISFCAIIAPFLATQVFAYRQYCVENFTTIPQEIAEYGRRRSYHIIGSHRPLWCNHTIPLAYSAVQASHWNLGFLRYFEMKQWPNFLLATPVVLLAILGVTAFIWNYSTVMRTAGLLQSAFMSIRDGRERMIVKRLTPYVVHLMLILVLLMFNIHVQVLTRLIFSSTPCIYWIIGYFLSDRIYIYESANNMDVFKRLDDKGKLPAEVQIERLKRGNLVTDDLLQFWQLEFTKKMIILYFVSYFFLGIYMHGTCLPWT